MENRDEVEDKGEEVSFRGKEVEGEGEEDIHVGNLKFIPFALRLLGG